MKPVKLDINNIALIDQILNTYKEKFPNMYRFVTESGYKEISREFDNGQTTI